MKECIFECGEPEDDAMIEVEMNATAAGFVAHQNHELYPHGGNLIHAERVNGWAHTRCYKAWYEKTYRTAFTMNA